MSDGSSEPNGRKSHLDRFRTAVANLIPARVRPGTHDSKETAIDNFIVRLRRYIENEPARPRHLLTVRGVGYRFVAEPKH